MFSAPNMRRCHLQKKNCANIRDFEKALFLNYRVTLAFARKII